MKPLMLGMALCLAALACGSPMAVGPDMTVLIWYSHVPTSADSSAVVAQGARRAVIVRVISAIAARGPSGPERYSGLPGVLRSQDCGSDEDPLLTVYIDVVDAPTQEDSAFVVSIGAYQVDWALYGRLAAVMRLSLVDRLGERSRFTRVEVRPATLHPIS